MRFFLAVLVILLSVQILLRFAFGKTLSWSEEVSRFAFVWAVYFGFVLAARENKHIRVTAQFHRLRPKAQIILFTLADAIWSVFNFVMVFVSGKFTLSMIRYPYVAQSVVGIYDRSAWVYGCASASGYGVEAQRANRIFRLSPGWVNRQNGMAIDIALLFVLLIGVPIAISIGISSMVGRFGPICR